MTNTAEDRADERAVTQHMVERCLVEIPDRIDESALAQARNCLIDGLSCALAACRERPINILREVMLPKGGGEASLIGSGEGATCDIAALLNGAMVSLLLFDDNHVTMRGHPSGPVLPAVLALAEAQDLSLDTMLRAFVLGYEVECMLSPLLNPSQYEIGWHATATQGVMGATLAASHLLGLDVVAGCHAVGIAGSLASGIRHNFGTMTMSLHSGLAASNGIRAARLAAAGFTADPDVFGGELSLGNALSHDWDESQMAAQIDSWGAPFAITNPGPTFKLYPCGRPPLAAVDCIMEMRDEEGLVPEDVEAIECFVSYMYPRTLIHPRPTTGLQGKTSLEYCVASALLDDGPGLTSFTDEAVRRPAIGQIIDRITVTVPPELSADVPDVRNRPFDQPVRLVVRTVSGRMLERTVVDHRGMPGNPATNADRRRKLLSCIEGRYDSALADKLLAYVAAPDASTRGLLAMVRL